jgi:7,8-dihydropterin-6-yl-methyl-4-(beta-D-ribofuranosyl)aminobenzene 5'-phosphate synthase
MGTGLRRCDKVFLWQRWCAVFGALTTGNISRQSFERVLQNTLVESEDGADPSPGHFTDAERLARLVPDQNPDEHATYVVQGRGLVVISSCGHVGLINTTKAAMAVSGVGTLHAVLGRLVIPMHCSGASFLAAMHRQMPDRLVTANIGSRFALGV